MDLTKGPSVAETIAQAKMVDAPIFATDLPWVHCVCVPQAMRPATQPISKNVKILMSASWNEAVVSFVLIIAVVTAVLVRLALLELMVNTARQ